MTKLIISDEAAKAVVKAGTTLKTKSVQKVPRIQDAPASEEKDSLRPAVLASTWSQNAAGLWIATAQFIVNDTIDTSFTFPVCAPTATARPENTVGTSRFYVVWRGRWELVDAGLTTEQVDSEISRILANSLITKSIASPNGFDTDSDGYLTIGTYQNPIKYYGVE